MSDIILALNKATKLYAGVPAIDGVDFELRRGEIHVRWSGKTATLENRR